MAAQLSLEDRDLVRKLREAGVLQDVGEYLLDQREGVILVSCADGDRFFDIFQNQVKMQAAQRHDPRIHVLSWHGGALACVPSSPVNRRKRTSEVFLDQIADARAIKNINTVALYAHAPCGAAALGKVGLERAICLQIRAKTKIKTVSPGIEVACFFHIDYGDSNIKRTYFLSRQKWECWAKANH